MSLSAKVECGGCGRGYSRATWSALPVLRTLTERDVRAYVVGWGERRVIEVRACLDCGRPMARAATRAA
jgi:hypothetical protein